jgi:hypothetical protein
MAILAAGIVPGCNFSALLSALVLEYLQTIQPVDQVQQAVGFAINIVAFHGLLSAS